MADAIFAMQQRMEKQGRRTLECLRQEFWRRNREKELSDNYVMIVKDMYEGARTRANTLHGQ